MPIQVTFQLDNSRERADMAKYINAIEACQNPYSNRQAQTSFGRQVSDNQDSAKIKELEKEKKELQDDLERYRKQAEKDAKALEKYQQELITLQKENEKKINEAEKALKLAEEVERKSNKIEADYKLKLQEKDAERKREINRLNDLREGEEKKLHNRIDELLKQLEIYNPSLNMRTNAEISYYKVEGNMLVETNSMDAPYSAQSMGDNKYRFQFNWEKGPVQEACANKADLLIPFCDIVEETENPSVIKPGDWGTAIMVGGDLKVETKAKIKLYRG